MPTNYIDDADIDGWLEPAVWQELFKQQNGTYDSNAVARRVRAADFASMLARTALENAGYTPGTSTDNDAVKTTAMAFFLRIAFGRKKLAMPDAYDVILAGLPEGVRLGQVPIPDLDADPDHAVGGNQWTESDTSVTGSKPRVFGDLRETFG